MHDWQHIVKQHGPLVWHVAFRVLQNRDDTADCHQEVFVEAIRRTESSAIDDWPAFLRWLTVRRAIDRLRSRTRQRDRIDPELEVYELAGNAPADSDTDWTELIGIVRSELARIPELQAQVFWLHCIEEVEMSDVAIQLELTQSHTRVLLHRCRERLRAALEFKHPSLIDRPER
ncbi:MAG: sigma-70 family RNA polymerase sigma factor [Fuerstiella sp.]